jgi:hypothetical protein
MRRMKTADPERPSPLDPSPRAQPTPDEIVARRSSTICLRLVIFERVSLELPDGLSIRLRSDRRVVASAYRENVGIDDVCWSTHQDDEMSGAGRAHVSGSVGLEDCRSLRRVPKP